jgi:hypothetical protein
MSKVFLNNLKNNAVKSKKFIQTASEKIEDKIIKNKNSFLNDFDNHPVTKEIQDGPDASNNSNTLGGKGNLFSYIGFQRTDKPIKDLRSFLASQFKFKKNINKKNKIQYIIDLPSITQIKEETRMPWENGKSWVIGIEKGISGLSNYLYKKWESSRSGSAIQTPNSLRGLSFKPMPYLSELLAKLRIGLRR